MRKRLALSVSLYKAYYFQYVASSLDRIQLDIQDLRYSWVLRLPYPSRTNSDLAVKVEENCGLNVLRRSSQSFQFWKSLAMLSQSAASFIDNLMKFRWLHGACHLLFFYQFFKLLDNGPFSLNLVESADNDKWDGQE